MTLSNVYMYGLTRMTIHFGLTTYPESTSIPGNFHLRPKGSDTSSELRTMVNKGIKKAKAIYTHPRYQQLLM